MDKQMQDEINQLVQDNAPDAVEIELEGGQRFRHVETDEDTGKETWEAAGDAERAFVVETERGHTIYPPGADLSVGNFSSRQAAENVCRINGWEIAASGGDRSI